MLFQKIMEPEQKNECKWNQEHEWINEAHTNVCCIASAMASASQTAAAATT